MSMHIEPESVKGEENNPHKQDPQTGRFVGKLSKEEWSAVGEAYLAGASMSEICKRFGLRSTGSAWYILHKLGVPVRSNRKSSDEAKRQMVEEYESGKTLREIGKEYGVNKSTVRHILEFRKVKRREVHECGRTYKLNDAVFDTITEESAYWIGFLMADGNVTAEDNPTISLGVAERDADHLIKFRNFLESDNPIRIYKNPCIFKTPKRTYQAKNTQPFHVIRIYSKMIARALKQYGVVPQKSLTAKVIGLEDDRHFWRGAVDGDGFVCLYKGNGYQVPALGLCGSKYLVQQFADFVEKMIGYAPRIHTHGSIVSVRLNCSYAESMGHVLYDNCSVALARKIDAVQSIFERAARIRENKLKKCSLPGCDRRLFTNRMCRFHWMQAKK